MNILGLSNHVRFNKIFDACRNEDGKISWLKVSQIRDLPSTFIMQYFQKLKNFGIEKNQILEEDVITAFKNELNWYSLVKYQTLTETCIDDNIDIVNKLKLWHLILKSQKLSVDWIIKHINKIKEDPKLLNSIEQNGQLSKENIATIKMIISSQ